MSIPPKVAIKCTVYPQKTLIVKNQSKITRACSCIACDSGCCFEKRHNNENVCNCAECTTDSCLISFVSKDINQRLTDTPVKLKNPLSDIKITKHNPNKNIFWDNDFEVKNGPMDKNYLKSVKDSYEKDGVSIHNVTVETYLKERVNSAAELTAQVLNVPLQELRQSVSFSVTAKENLIISDSNKCKQDIFSRLKEVYKACSCKICECIAGKSLFPRNNLCKCEPCDCTHCPSFILKKSPSLASYEKYYIYDKKINKDAVNIIEKNIACNCVPCNCIKCNDDSLKPCNCEPCNCFICNYTLMRSKKGQTIIIAPKTEHVHTHKDIRRSYLLNSIDTFNSSIRSTSKTYPTQATYQHEACTNEGYDKKVTNKHSERKNCEFDSLIVHNALVVNSKTAFGSLNCKNNISNSVHTFDTYNEIDSYRGTKIKEQIKCMNCKDNCKIKDVTKLALQNLSPSHGSLKNVSYECVSYNDSGSNRTNIFGSIKPKTSTRDINDCYNIFYYLKRTMTTQNMLMESNQINSTNITNETDCTCDTLFRLKQGKILNPITIDKNTNNLCDQESEFTKGIANGIENKKHAIQHSVINHNVSCADFQKTESIKKDLNRKKSEVKSRPESDKIMHRDKHQVTNSRIKLMSNKLLENNQNIEKINETIQQSYLQEQSVLSNIGNSFLITNESFSKFHYSSLNKNAHHLISNSKKSVSQVLKNSGNISNINEDNQRFNKTIQSVRKTLQEAKEYTKNLVIILEKSIKANDDFVSVTQKTKYLNNKYLYKATRDSPDFIAENSNCKNNKSLEINISNIYNVNLNMLSKFDNEVRKNKQCFYHNKAQHLQDSINENRKAEYNNEHELAQKVKDHKVSRDYDMQYLSYKVLKNHNREISNDSKNISALIQCSDIENRVSDIKRKYKTSDRTLLNADDRRSNLNNNTLSNLPVKLYYNALPLNPRGLSYSDLERDIVSIKTIFDQREVCEDCSSYRGLSVPLLLQSESRNKFANESSQTSKKIIYVEKETNCNRVFSTEKLHCIMDAYIENIITRVVFESERSEKRSANFADVGCEVPRAYVFKNVLENLKARFTGIQRISEHSIIVRWKTPSDLDGVLGYEVNGRTFEKIMHPTKCMAVVTCLPRADKILLTIQTITSTRLTSNRKPTNTVVYYPHLK